MPRYLLLVVEAVYREPGGTKIWSVSILPRIPFTGQKLTQKVVPGLLRLPSNAEQKCRVHLGLTHFNYVKGRQGWPYMYTVVLHGITEDVPIGSQVLVQDEELAIVFCLLPQES
jgi:hypothetical protein